MSRVHPGETVGYLVHEPKDDDNKSNDGRSSKTTKDDTKVEGGADRKEKRNSIHHRLSNSFSNGINGL